MFLIIDPRPLVLAPICTQVNTIAMGLSSTHSPSYTSSSPWISLPSPLALSFLILSSIFPYLHSSPVSVQIRIPLACIYCYIFYHYYIAFNYKHSVVQWIWEIVVGFQTLLYRKTLWSWLVWDNTCQFLQAANACNRIPRMRVKFYIPCIVISRCRKIIYKYRRIFIRSR